MEKFKALGLSEKNIYTIKKKGFEEPTEIQSLTIPLLLQNKIDIVAQAQTGTGKTAAFALPLIERIDTSKKKIQALILAPTRELVIQVCEEINSLKGDNNKLSVAPIYGGQSIDLQLKQLKKGVSIVVGTPGRILDHIRRDSLHLDDIKYFSLDEADEMLNMGFIEDVEKIIEETPEEKRVLLFSATMPKRIIELAEKYMGEYTHLKTQTEITPDLTEQIYFEVEPQDKFEALCRIIDMESDFYSIIFCKTKLDVDEIVLKLLDRGYSADGLHGDISQAQREKILGKFRKRLISILVATDVASRGIDISNLTHVINYSIPHNPEAYIHRIGRTGRAGNQGTAITFVTPEEFRRLGFIKHISKANIRKEEIPEVKDIIEAKKRKIAENIKNTIIENDMDKYKDWAKTLIRENNAENIIAAVLKHSFDKILNEYNYQNISTKKKHKHKQQLIEEEGKTRLFIALGKKDNLRKKDIANFIEKKAGVSKKVIKDIEVYDNFSFINVPFDEAEIIIKVFKKLKGKGKTLVERAKEKK